MKIIVCVDESMGMAFGGRRLSRDREVTARILEITKGRELFISPYSAPLFEGAENAVVSESFLSEAGDGDYLFAETADPSPLCASAEQIIIYKWNRRYPSDLKFTYSPEKDGRRLESVFEFAGYSHEKITEEIWMKA